MTDLMRKYGNRGAQEMLAKLLESTLRWENGEITAQRAMEEVGDVFSDVDLDAALREALDAVADAATEAGGPADLSSLGEDIDPENVTALAEDGLLAVMEADGTQYATVTK